MPAPITNADDTWRTAPAAGLTAEIWQVENGEVRFSTDATPAWPQGTLLAHRDTLRVEAGQVVKYRLAAGCKAALITRETFG